MYDEYRGRLNLVLMDIRMPEIDGYECTRIIKEKDPGIPVIAQTAYAMSGERDQSMEAGCDDYISKPIQVKSLIETIGRHLK
jgi:two-component system cell cycle response regulator DivK